MGAGAGAVAHLPVGRLQLSNLDDQRVYLVYYSKIATYIQVVLIAGENFVRNRFII